MKQAFAARELHLQASPQRNPKKQIAMTASPQVTDDSTTAGWATRQNLLDAAERLIAQHGVAGSSLRKITSDAGTNLAAANYHFGTKEGLVKAVVSRHLGPLNGERLRRLAALEADGDPSLEELVQAFVGPVIRYGLERQDQGRDIAKIFGRAMTQPEDTLRDLLMQEMRPVIHRFSAAFGQALPHLGQQELMWRIFFMIGSMGHTMAGAHMLERVTDGMCNLQDRDGLLKRLQAFLCAGLRAPATLPADSTAAPSSETSP